MPCQEAEAVGLFFQKHLAQVAVAKAYLTGIGNGSGNTECLKALSDGSRCICSLAAPLFDGNSGAYGISPACVLKADGLDLLHLLVYVKPCVFGNLLSFFDRRNTIALQNFRDFINTSFI